MRIKGEHLGPIPEGHQIYADRLEVMGLVKRKADATRFVRGRDQRLEIEQDPDNPVDRNALKVVGYWKGWFLEHRAHLGYVPREVAKLVADLDVSDVIRPRLARTYLSAQGFVQVFFQLTGPKEQAREFKQALEAEAGK